MNEVAPLADVLRPCIMAAPPFAFTCLRIPCEGLPEGLGDAETARGDLPADFVLYRPVGGVGLPIAVERTGGRAEILLPQIRL